MWVLTLGSTFAGEPAAVVIGAQPLWSDACALEGRWDASDAACLDPDNLLRYSDDDVLRVRDVLSATLGAERVVSVARPDASTDALLPALGCATLGLDCVREAVTSAGWDQPVDLVLYYSGHGTCSGVHLEDGVHERAELVDAALGGAPPGSKVTLLVADTCRASCMKGDEQGPTSIGDATLADIELVVQNDARFVPSAEGSAFTLLLLGALAQGGREKSVSELRSDLDRHAAAFDVAVEVRARGANTQIRVAALTPTLAAGGARIVLPPGPARWILQRRLRAGASDRYLVYYDVNVGDQPTAMAVPAGDWHAYEVLLRDDRPYLLGGDAGPITLQAGQSFEIPREGWRVPYLIPDPQAKGEIDTVSPSAARLGGYVWAHRHRAPTRLPASRYAAWSGTSMALGVAVASPLFAREPMSGPTLTWRRGRGRVQALSRLAAATEVSDRQPARLSAFELAGGADVGIRANDDVRLGWSMTAGVAAYAMHAPALASRTSLGFVVDTGPSIAVRRGRVFLEARVEAKPRIVLVADADGVAPRLELARGGATISAGVAW